jgi:hypothetical protein
MNHNGIFSLSFPEAKTIIVSGDIHGDFNQLGVQALYPISAYGLFANCCRGLWLWLRKERVL